MSLPKFRTPLPIDTQIPAALALLREHAALVVQAPPGVGKTTRLPPALLDDGILGRDQEVLVLEPRRIAARMAAARVAGERDGRLGDEVGYRVRFEHQTSRETRLCYVTEGVLVRRLQRDPELSRVGAVFFDEFHERNLEADLSLGFVREIQQAIRPDLRVIVMSATLDPGPLAAYLGGCPVLASSGRGWPIAVEHEKGDREQPVEIRAAAALSRCLRDGLGGSVLVFMPGAAEIRRTLHAMEPLARQHGLDLVPLHGDLPPEAQQAAVRQGPRPRVVISTNLAEASITVEGIELVIDSGLARVARFDPYRGMNRMSTERISRSSAVQRAGRAGRLGPGRCIRLYTEDDFAAMEEAEEPEVRRVDLSEALLQILAWGTRDPASFGWLTPPDPAGLERAETLLRSLGAIHRDRPVLTDLGRDMRAVPAHPRLGRMLLEARARGCLAEASLLAALASERDLRLRGPIFGARVETTQAQTHANSDLLLLAESLAAAEALRFDPVQTAALGIDARAARLASRGAAHLRQWARGRPPAPLPWNERLEEDLLRCVASGYPDRVVRRRIPESREGRMVGGMGTRLDPASSVTKEEFYVALDAVPARDEHGRYVRVRLASGVRAEWLAELFPESIVTREEVRFDEESERVTARRVTRFHDLPLREHETGTPDPEAAGRALFEAAGRRPERALEITPDLENLVTRLRWLSARRPELVLPAGPPRAAAGARVDERQPDVDPLLLAALAPLCRDRRSFGELRKAPLLDSLLGLLSWETRRLLDAEAPARITLPSGRAARLEYRPEDAPVLAGRIQEFFGTERTPTVGGASRDAVPVVLQLLAPSGRPVQVTSDLASFWRTVYPKLRLELRRRYPKHAWPEDPLSAVPVSRAPSRPKRG